MSVLSGFLLSALLAQQGFPPGFKPIENIRTEPEKVERLGEGLYRVGTIRVDTQKREATVDGKVTDARSLEFIASTNSGIRSYESAFQLSTDAFSFNVAMILIGLDKANAVSARYHFDPEPPKGDPVEIWIEWTAGGQKKKMRAEEMLIDTQTKKKFPRSDWVYTGSFVTPEGIYLAESGGVAIGFVHDPGSIIELPLSTGLGRFGFIQLDSALKIPANTPISVTVRSIKKVTK
jgi:hypothetical protein